jgi:hypothetical protein
MMLTVALALFGQNSQNRPPTLDNLPKQFDIKVKQIVNWGEAISTRGARLEFREAQRGEKDGKLAITYDFYVTGAPSNPSYALYQYPITYDEPQLVLPEVSFDRTGRLCAKIGKDCSVPVRLVFVPKKRSPSVFYWYRRMERLPSLRCLFLLQLALLIRDAA